MLKLTTWSRVALRTVTTFNWNLDKQIEININELLTFVCLTFVIKTRKLL